MRNISQGALWAGVRFGIVLGTFIGFFQAERIRQLIHSVELPANAVEKHIEAGKQAVRQQQSSFD